MALNSCACQISNPAFDAWSTSSSEPAGTSNVTDSSADTTLDEHETSDSAATELPSASSGESLATSTSDTLASSATKTATSTSSVDGSDTTSNEETSLSLDDESEDSDDETDDETDETNETDNETDDETADFDGTLPNLGMAVPLPTPLCPDDSDLLVCLDFDDSSLTTLSDSSPYRHDAHALNAVRRWSHADASVDLLRYGWETGFDSDIWIDANVDLTFRQEVRVEAWWHPLPHSLYDGYPVVALDDMITIVTSDSGYHCVLRIGDGGYYSYALAATRGTGIEYVSCSLKSGQLLMEAANTSAVSKTHNVGLADLMPYTSNLHVLHGRDIGTEDRSQAAVIYAVRVWRRADR